MAKTERGLPKSFDIRVPEGPVRLGDYLDEAPAAAPPPSPSVTPVTPPEPDVVAASPALRRTNPPRKQFNMAPETLRMIDELLAQIRMHSAERDVRASELVHALVLAVHEVRPFLDLTQVPPRGKWGSPSAAALPVALKETFQKAVAKSRGR
jgi:hypothetical protein